MNVITWRYGPAGVLSFHTKSSLGGKLVACQEADGASGSQQALCYDSYQHQIGFVQSCPAMHHGAQACALGEDVWR